MSFLIFFGGMAIGGAVLFAIIGHFASSYNNTEPVSDESVACLIQGLIFLVLCGISGLMMFYLIKIS
jgi:hypothetical protein